VFILIALLNKFVAKHEEGKQTEMGIMSAVSVAKCTIFIEAFRESQVKLAVTGIQNLYGECRREGRRGSEARRGWAGVGSGRTQITGEGSC
jgi:hypothetical protein